MPQFTEVTDQEIAAAARAAVQKPRSAFDTNLADIAIYKLTIRQLAWQREQARLVALAKQAQP